MACKQKLHMPISKPKRHGHRFYNEVMNWKMFIHHILSCNHHIIIHYYTFGYCLLFGRFVVSLANSPISILNFIDQIFPDIFLQCNIFNNVNPKRYVLLILTFFNMTSLYSFVILAIKKE